MGLETLNINVTNTEIGTIVYQPGGTCGPRNQKSYQLVLLHSGSMQANIDHETFHLQPGHMALLEPGHREWFVFSEVEETWHQWIVIDIDPVIINSNLKTLPFQIPISEEMNQLMKLLVSLHQKTMDSKDPLLCRLCQSAIELFWKESETFSTAAHHHPTVAATKIYIQKNFGKELSLIGLANKNFVTPEHLSRLFRKEVGIPISRYIWEYRVRRGVALLQNTGLTVSEVAERCGFKTSNHFSRQVKLITGSTPSDIRKHSWK